MKKLKIKLVVATLTFIIGITGVWASSAFSSFTLSFIDLFLPVKVDAPPTEDIFIERALGNVEIRFKQHLKIEGINYAEFEVVNHNRLPVGYFGYNRNSYCKTFVKRGNTIEQNNQCWCGTDLEVQTLRAGETASFKVSEFDVRYLLKQGELKVTKQYSPSEEIEEFIPDKRKVTTQIGFEFLAGAELHKEVVWSDTISFPK